jgi:hypothetical protein
LGWPVFDEQETELVAVRHDRIIKIEHVAAPAESLPAAPLRDAIEVSEVIRPTTSAASETNRLEDAVGFLEGQRLDAISEGPMELAGRPAHRRLLDEVEMVREPDDGGDIRIEGRVPMEPGLTG